MKAKELLKLFEDHSLLPFSARGIKKAFAQKLEYLDIEGVVVEDVDIEMDGDIVVSFSDSEGDEVAILFQVDGDEIEAIVLDDEEFEGEEDEMLVIDLSPLNPSVYEVESLGLKYLNLTDLSWLNKSALVSLLQAGEVGLDADDVDPSTQKKDPLGHKIDQDLGYYESLDERSVVVTRGGKRVKLSVVRRKRRKRLTAKQRQGIRKSVLKRKAKKTQIQRKRKRSLNLRKRMGLKRQKAGFRKKFKVRG